jgi:serine/threonine protein phosphatase PrpC
MDSCIIPSANNQDYAGSGRIHDTDYIFVFDGHGTNRVIDQIRAMNMDDIALSSNPVLAVHDQLKGDSYRSGSTMAFARKTGTRIETFNCGDSMIWVYVNGGLRHVSTAHTFTNPQEIERTRHLVQRIQRVMAPFPVSDHTVEEILSTSGLFHTGETLVPSQSLGHNNMTELAPECFTYIVQPTDHVRMVVASDGFSDMLVNPVRGGARTLAEKAVERWKQQWNYLYQGRMVQTHFGDVDDVGVVVYDDEIKFRPAMCIPWSPLHFTTSDVQATCEAVMGGVLRVDEVVKETHKVFFIHFLPSKMDDGNHYVYGKQRMKLYYSQDWYWNMSISHYTSPLRCVDDVYGRWDKTGSYEEFRESQLPSHVCYKIWMYFDQFR